MTELKYITKIPSLSIFDILFLIDPFKKAHLCLGHKYKIK